MRQTIKTIIGVLVIGLIVVATFLYGNKQRQDQLRRDSEAKSKAQQTASATVTPTPQLTTSSTDQAPGGATAPVPKPTGSDLQYSTTTIAAAATDAAAKAPTTIPDTGAADLSLAPFTALLMLAMAYSLKTSKSRLRQAALRAF